MIDLSSKRAVVCGSTRGMGKATAITFAELGAEVILIARNRDLLEGVVSELPVKSGQTHGYLCADFSDPDALRETVNNDAENGPPIHILVNNTGGPAHGEITEAGSAEFLDGFSKHLLCNQILAQAFIPGMKKENYGRIINIISTAGLKITPTMGVYSATKNAVRTLSETFRQESDGKIRITGISPGFVDTDFATNIKNEEMRTAILNSRHRIVSIDVFSKQEPIRKLDARAPASKPSGIKVSKLGHIEIDLIEVTYKDLDLKAPKRKKKKASQSIY